MRLNIAAGYRGGEGDFKFASAAELKQLPQNSRQWFKAEDGLVRMLTVTSVKTWKRKADVEVRVRYGLYEFARLLNNTTTILIKE